MKKFDFSQIEFTDIDGNTIFTVKIEDHTGKLVDKPIHKVIAGGLWANAPSLFIHESAIKINKLEPFDISPDEISELLSVIIKSPFSFYLKQPILNHLKNLQNGKNTIDPVTESENTVFNTQAGV